MITNCLQLSEIRKHELDQVESHELVPPVNTTNYYTCALIASLPKGLRMISSRVKPTKGLTRNSFIGCPRNAARHVSVPTRLRKAEPEAPLKTTHSASPAHATGTASDRTPRTASEEGQVLRGD